MKRAHIFLTILLQMICLTSLIQAAPSLFVDPAAGNDQAAGTMEAPIRTLSAALNKIPMLVTEDYTIELAKGTYTDSGAAGSSLELNRVMKNNARIIIKGHGADTILDWQSSGPMISANAGNWRIESVQIGSRKEKQREGILASNSSFVELKDVRIHTASQSAAGIHATRGATIHLFGKIELNEDLHDNAGEGESFCGIEADYHGVVRFREKENATLSIGNGSLSAGYYGVIELGCANAKITSWHDQANVIAVNNSGRIDFHNTKAELAARNPRNTPIGLEHDGHVLAEGAPITIRGYGNGNAIVLQKSSTFFCNDVTLTGELRTPLSCMSNSTLLAGVIGDLSGGEVMTGGIIILEKCTGKLTGRINVYGEGRLVLPSGIENPTGD